MKKVKFTYNIIKPNMGLGKYQVWLGGYNENGEMNYYYFTSQEKAEKFIKKSNKFFTDIIHELNLIYATVSYEYRLIWGTFNLDQIDFEIEFDIVESLRFCEDNFNKIIELSAAESKNLGAHTNKLLNHNCDYLLKTIEILLDKVKKQSSTSDIYRYKFILNEILRLKNSLNTYGKDTILYST